jgi:hypothetical protein
MARLVWAPAEQAIVDAAAADTFKIATGAYWRGAIIQTWARAGYSTYAVQRALMQAGVGFRHSQVASVYAAALQQAQVSQGFSERAAAVLGGQLVPGPAPNNWTGHYDYGITITTRTGTWQEGYSLGSRTIYVTSDSALTAEDAVTAGMQQIGAMTEDAREDYGIAGGTQLVAELTGMWYRTNQRGLGE